MFEERLIEGLGAHSYFAPAILQTLTGEEPHIVVTASMIDDLDRDIEEAVRYVSDIVSSALMENDEPPVFALFSDVDELVYHGLSSRRHELAFCLEQHGVMTPELRREILSRDFTPVEFADFLEAHLGAEVVESMNWSSDELSEGLEDALFRKVRRQNGDNPLIKAMVENPKIMKAFSKVSDKYMKMDFQSASARFHAGKLFEPVLRDASLAYARSQFTKDLGKLKNFSKRQRTKIAKSVDYKFGEHGVEVNVPTKILVDRPEDYIDIVDLNFDFKRVFHRSQDNVSCYGLGFEFDGYEVTYSVASYARDFQRMLTNINLESEESVDNIEEARGEANRDTIMRAIMQRARTTRSNVIIHQALSNRMVMLLFVEKVFQAIKNPKKAVSPKSFFTHGFHRGWAGRRISTWLSHLSDEARDAYELNGSYDIMDSGNSISIYLKWTPKVSESIMQEIKALKGKSIDGFKVWWRGRGTGSMGFHMVLSVPEETLNEVLNFISEVAREFGYSEDDAVREVNQALSKIKGLGVGGKSSWADSAVRLSIGKNSPKALRDAITSKLTRAFDNVAKLAMRSSGFDERMFTSFIIDEGPEDKWIHVAISNKADFVEIPSKEAESYVKRFMGFLPSYIPKEYVRSRIEERRVLMYLDYYKLANKMATDALQSSGVMESEEPLTESISKQELDELERYLDKLFAKSGIDLEFTKHFFDRVNDARNKSPIQIEELRRIFKKVALNQKLLGKITKDGAGFQGVLKDVTSKINSPFVLVLDKKNNELDLVAKTVMRKDNFKTPNKTFSVKTEPVPPLPPEKGNKGKKRRKKGKKPQKKREPAMAESLTEARRSPKPLEMYKIVRSQHPSLVEFERANRPSEAAKHLLDGMFAMIAEYDLWKRPGMLAKKKTLDSVLRDAVNYAFTDSLTRLEKSKWDFDDLDYTSRFNGSTSADVTFVDDEDMEAGKGYIKDEPFLELVSQNPSDFQIRVGSSREAQAWCGRKFEEIFEMVQIMALGKDSKSRRSRLTASELLSGDDSKACIEALGEFSNLQCSETVNGLIVSLNGRGADRVEVVHEGSGTYSAIFYSQEGSITLPVAEYEGLTQELLQSKFKRFA